MALQILHPPVEVVPPWDGAIAQLSLSRTYFSDHELMGPVSRAVWHISLHWVIRKKWASRHRIPCDRKLAKDIEPIGDVLRAVLELAIQVHAVDRRYGHQYLNAAEWFGLAAPELHRLLIGGGGSGKAADIKTLQGVKQSFSDLENPVPHDLCPHLWALIEASITASNRSDPIRNRYWRGMRKVKPDESKGLVFALAAWISELKNNPIWRDTRAVEGGIEFRRNQGKGTHFIAEF
jgi:hypothetical protein